MTSPMGQSRDVNVTVNANVDPYVKSMTAANEITIKLADGLKKLDEKIVQIEGDPDSPVSRGRLCPKGSASKSLVTSPTRVTTVKYRAPYATEWTDLGLDEAMEMIADRVLAARTKGWQDTDGGKRVNRTMGIASLGGATLDNEENYLMKKLYSAMGAIQIENQARI